MPSINPTSVLTEYVFSDLEQIQAKQLTPLQVMWLQNKFALKFKEKASKIIPSDSLMDRDFLLQMGEIEGYLNCIQEIFDDAKQSAQDMLDINKDIEEGKIHEDVQIQTLGERASNRVDNG